MDTSYKARKKNVSSNILTCLYTTVAAVGIGYMFHLYLNRESAFMFFSFIFFLIALIVFLSTIHIIYTLVKTIQYKDILDDQYINQEISNSKDPIKQDQYFLHIHMYISTLTIISLVTTATCAIAWKTHSVVDIMFALVCIITFNAYIYASKKHYDQRKCNT